MRVFLKTGLMCLPVCFSVPVDHADLKKSQNGLHDASALPKVVTPAISVTAKVNTVAND